MKKNGVWEVILRIFIAAATAALTALGTTSCMGQGPIGFQHGNKENQRAPQGARWNFYAMGLTFKRQGSYTYGE